MNASRWSIVAAAFFLCAVAVVAQPGTPGKSSLIVKFDSEALPVDARARLGKLSGYRYTGQFNSAIMSSDAKLLAIASMSNGAVEILDTTTGKLVQSLKAQAFGSVASMSFTPDGKVLAIESFGQDLKLWEIASGKQLHQLNHRNNNGGQRPGPSFSKDGKIVCIGSERFINNKGNQGEIKAWEVATAKVIGPFETLHNYNIRGAVSPDGKTMVSWGHYSPRGAMGPADREIPKTIQVWDLAKGKEARQIKLDFGPQGFGNIVDIAFAPDGKTLAVTSGMSTFHLFDYETGKETRRFSGMRGSNVLRFAPDGQILAAYDMYGGQIQAWNMKTGARLELADGPKTQIMGVGFPGGNRVIALGNLSQSLIWWEATADEKASPFAGHLSPITGLAYAPDGKTLITAGSDQRLIWWNSHTGQQERELRLIDDDGGRYGYGGGGPFNPITLSPNARYAATVSFVGNGAVRLWNLKSGKAMADFEGPRSYSQPGMAFSPDSTRIASSGVQYPLHIWNVTTGQELPKLPALPGQNDGGNGPSRIAFSPNGQMVAVHLNHFDRFTGQPISDLIVWDLVKSRELHRLKIPMPNFGGVGGSGNIAFSLDSHFLAMSDGAGTITLLNTLTGSEWRRLASSLRNSAFTVAFSTDGRFLAAGSIPRHLGGVNIQNDEPSIEIWEIASGLKRDQFKGHTSAITCLAFSPDGATLASGSMDTTTLLWDLTGKSGPKVSPITESELPAAWNALVGKDPGLALTMRRMAFAPAPTVAFLKKTFLPVKGEVIDEKTLDTLVANLDSSNFRVREQATKELTRLGERAEPAFKKGLDRNLTVEARRRMQDIFAAIVRHEYTPGELQAVRAVEVLERIGTPDARAWLVAHSQADPIAVATREARKALKRMAVN